MVTGNGGVGGGGGCVHYPGCGFVDLQFAEAIFSPGCHLVSIGLSISSKFTVVAVHSKPVQ